MLTRTRLRPWRAAVPLPVIAVLVLAACQGAEPNELSVLEWSGYEDPSFWTDFQTASPDTNVTFQFGSSDSDILGKVEAAPNSYDLFHFYSGWQQFYVDEGLVREIDTSKLTNWDQVPDAFKEQGQVNGKQYYLPWDWGYTSVLYNTDHVANVDSWDALFDDAYAGHISMWDDGPGAVTVSSYIHGWDETQITSDQLAQIEQEWTDQKALLSPLGYWVSEYDDLCPNVESGDIWVAYDWQGCYATVLYSGSQPVAYADPQEGRNSWIGFYGISAQTDSYELALKFIDAKLAEMTCGNLLTLYYYGCVNQDVTDAVDDPVLIEAFSLDDPAVLEHTNFTPPVTEQQRTDWTDMWARVKAAP